MTHPLHFGVTLPQIKRTWEEARSAALAFDALRYDSVWACDHVYGVPNPALPIFEAWSQLAAVAAITEHFELGTLVTPPLFRNPAVLAKQLATIDHVSSGRVIAGLGAGWFEPEFTQYGIEFGSLGDRMRALDETAQVLRRLWTDETVTFDGAFAHLTDARCEPKPVRRTPILIGGTGERVLMGIAARCGDIWNNMAITQGQLASKVEALYRQCDAHDRDPAEIVISQQCTVVIAETEEEAQSQLARAQKVFGGHLGSGLEEHGIWGHPERVIECIERHRELGCSMFIIEFFGRDTREPAQLFAEAVRPALG